MDHDPRRVGISGLVGIRSILSGIVLLIWGWRRGQFKDIEAAKYRMLEDKEPEAWSYQKEE